MICDICSNPGMGTVVSSSDMASAVRRGFNPVRLHMLPEAMLQLVGGMAYADKWAEQATTGMLSHSDWNICGDCMSKLRPYLSGYSPSPRSSSPSASGGGASSQATEKSQCFVATAVMGCDDAWEVVSLRRYRDAVLVKNSFGSALIALYWKLGPSLARFIGNRQCLREFTRRFIITPLARLADRRCNK